MGTCTLLSFSHCTFTADDYLDTVVFKDAYVSSLVLASADSHGSAASPENALLQRGIAALATALDWRKVTPTHPVLTLRPLVFAALIETLAALHNVPAATTLIDVDSEGEGTDPLWEGARLLVEDNSEQGQEVHRLAEEATLCVRSGWRTLQKGGWQRAEGASDSSPRDDAVEIVSSSSPAGDGATTGKRDTHAGSHVHSAAVLYMQQWLHEHPQVLDATYFARCPTEAPQDEEYVTGTEALWPCKRPHLTQGLAVECAAAFVSLASWINVQWIHPGLLIEIAQVIAQPVSDTCVPAAYHLVHVLLSLLHTAAFRSTSTTVSCQAKLCGVTETSSAPFPPSRAATAQ